MLCKRQITLVYLCNKKVSDANHRVVDFIQLIHDLCVVRISEESIAEIVASHSHQLECRVSGILFYGAGEQDRL